MRQRHNFKRAIAIGAGLLLAGSLEFQPGSGPAQLTLFKDSEAYARSSGGRAGGGSFRPSSPRSSGSSSSTRSNSSSSSSTRSNSSSSSPSRSYTRPQVVPVPVGPSIYNDPYRPNSNSSSPTSSSSNQNSESDDVVLVLVILAVSTIVILAIVGLFFWAVLYFINKVENSTGDNTKVTVSRVQVALLAQARVIQRELTHLCETIDTGTQEGLYQLLQESALLLLRSSENWSHALASSETVKTLDAATTLFNQLSIEERAKFSVEALSNVGGRMNRREFKPPSDEDPAAYIVATLLLGTSDDKPLFDQVKTAEELRTVLEKIASLPAEQLQVFELLWSPQTENDSLTYDELLTEYTDMAQI